MKFIPYKLKKILFALLYVQTQNYKLKGIGKPHSLVVEGVGYHMANSSLRPSPTAWGTCQAHVYA